MHKRILIAVLIALLLLCVGCRKTPATPTEPTAAPTDPSETFMPGVGIPDDGVIMEEEVDEPTETETAATQPEKDDETTSKETKPTENPEDNETTPPAETNPGSSTSTAYSDYMNMSAAQQEEFINSFESVDAFMAWFNQAKEEHNANDNSIEIGSGSIDLEEITGGD